MQVRKKISKQY